MFENELHRNSSRKKIGASSIQMTGTESGRKIHEYNETPLLLSKKHPKNFDNRQTESEINLDDTPYATVIQSERGNMSELVLDDLPPIIEKKKK